MHCRATILLVLILAIKRGLLRLEIRETGMIPDAVNSGDVPLEPRMPRVKLD